MISELLRKREALLSQGCGKVKRDGGELQQHCTPRCASQVPYGPEWGLGSLGSGEFSSATEQDRSSLKNWQLWESSEFITDLVSKVCSLKPSVTDPAASEPYGTCGGGNAVPLPPPFPMKVSFLLSPGILKLFLLLFMFTCPTLCIGTHRTQWEDTRWLQWDVLLITRSDSLYQYFICRS